MALTPNQLEKLEEVAKENPVFGLLLGVDDDNATEQTLFEICVHLHALNKYLQAELLYIKTNGIPPIIIEKGPKEVV
jgi:hypothetical protein